EKLAAAATAAAAAGVRRYEVGIRRQKRLNSRSLRQKFARESRRERQHAVSAVTASCDIDVGAGRPTKGEETQRRRKCRRVDGRGDAEYLMSRDRPQQAALALPVDRPARDSLTSRPREKKLTDCCRKMMLAMAFLEKRRKRGGAISSAACDQDGFDVVRATTGLPSYDINSDDLTLHLTNQAVQHRDRTYKNVKEATVWSPDSLNSYLNQHMAELKVPCTDWVRRRLYPRIREQSSVTVTSIVSSSAMRRAILHPANYSAATSSSRRRLQRLAGWR
uniref:H15 domain-containing protein n=1 Tax=Macrostomum lignano TaxID=282301 RepID=A0A1I8F622_9PLAT